MVEFAVVRFSRDNERVRRPSNAPQKNGKGLPGCPGCAKLPLKELEKGCPSRFAPLFRQLHDRTTQKAQEPDFLINADFESMQESLTSMQRELIE
jgi:hypothetical protein